MNKGGQGMRGMGGFGRPSPFGSSGMFGQQQQMPWGQPMQRQMPSYGMNRFGGADPNQMQQPPWMQQGQRPQTGGVSYAKPFQLPGMGNPNMGGQMDAFMALRGNPSAVNSGQLGGQQTGGPSYSEPPPQFPMQPPQTGGISYSEPPPQFQFPSQVMSKPFNVQQEQMPMMPMGRY